VTGALQASTVRIHGTEPEPSPGQLWSLLCNVLCCCSACVPHSVDAHVTDLLPRQMPACLLQVAAS
jgi:hypothetical protein